MTTEDVRETFTLRHETELREKIKCSFFVLNFIFVYLVDIHAVHFLDENGSYDTSLALETLAESP